MKILIIGNGITGITAARHIRKLSNHQITVVSAESEYFFSRTALMYVYMGHMKFEHTYPYENDFWKKNRIDLIYDKILSINVSNKTATTAKGNILNFDRLVIASGAQPKKLGVKNESLNGIQGLYSKQDLELMHQQTKNISKAAIIGGGLIGVEMAEMLHSRNIEVDFIIRDKSYWSSVLPAEESAMVHKHILSKGINIRENCEVEQFLGDENGDIKQVITKNNIALHAEFVGITIGVSPNIDCLKGSGIEVEHGVLVNDYLESNIKDIYAAGDCAQFKSPKKNHPPIEQLWYTGKMQAEILAKNICGEKVKYDRGIWFNSAKFFDLEYQTYGEVNPILNEATQTFYWQHPVKNIAMRINFKKENNAVIGFNFLGMRYKHLVAEEFIKNQISIAEVVNKLNVGKFDPEFSENYYPIIKKSFFQHFPEFLI